MVPADDLLERLTALLKEFRVLRPLPGLAAHPVGEAGVLGIRQPGHVGGYVVRQPRTLVGLQDAQEGLDPFVDRERVLPEDLVFLVGDLSGVERALGREL
jgi:hypothetical protein